MVTSSKADKRPELTPEEFVLKAIKSLREGTRGKGIHTVWSGFNKAFRDYFGDKADPIAITTQMRKDGQIAVLLAKGGVKLYIRTDLTEKTLEKHDSEWAERDSGESYKKPAKSGGSGTDALSKIVG